MGCFNMTGGFTGLPIYIDNRCVCFICVVSTKTKFVQSLDICGRNADLISPICPPLRGKYSDYGCIYDIEKDSVSDMLENIFGMSVDKIIETIDRGSRSNPAYDDMLEKLGLYADEYEFVHIIDHESAYQNVLEKHLYFDFDKSYDISKENRYYYEDNCPDNMWMKKDGFGDYMKLFNVDISFKRNAGRTMNMNPEIEQGVFAMYREPYPKEFLIMFKKYPDYMWIDGMKSHIVGFSRFWWSLYDMEIDFNISRYGRQTRYDRSQIDFMKHCLKIIKENEHNDYEESQEES